jgi:hypothetical protein
MGAGNHKVVYVGMGRFNFVDSKYFRASCVMQCSCGKASLLTGHVIANRTNEEASIQALVRLEW